MKFNKFLLKVFSIVLIIALVFSFFTFVYADEEELDDDSATSITYVLSDSGHKSTNSDVFIFQDVINIDYPVYGNVFAIGKDITISGSVDGNIFILANNLTITKESYITNDLYVAAESVRIAGYVSNLYCAANTFALVVASPP